jgi:hypothetical protein
MPPKKWRWSSSLRPLTRKTQFCRLGEKKAGKMTNEKLESLMEESISESKRTTHAVRALVRFTLIEVTVTLVAVALFGLIALLGGNFNAAYVVGGAVLVIGGLYALVAGWSELKQSEVGSNQAPQGYIDPIDLCKSCGAELHPFLSKCPACKKRPVPREPL